MDYYIDKYARQPLIHANDLYDADIVAVRYKCTN